MKRPRRGGGRRLAAAALLLATVLLDPAATHTPLRAQAVCEIVGDFDALLRQIGQAVVGECVEDATYSASGDAQQRTTLGLFVHREDGEWTAFTDGVTTWVAGPDGPQQRAHGERFAWEPEGSLEPDALPPLPSPTPPPAGPATVAPRPTRTPEPTPLPLAVPPTRIPVPAGATGVLLAAGDIAGCLDPQAALSAQQTASILEGYDGTIVALGDQAYERGSIDDYQGCYGPRWGRFKDRTRPALGNHEYGVPRAAGYFAYFGASVGDPGKGYYSYDAGGWHINVLNSNCEQIGGCEAGSPQERWLRADLKSATARCKLAYWHHPRFTSGRMGGTKELTPLWQALYDAGADVVLSGHEHNYERLAPMDASGTIDQARGIRSFVVGTGGRSHHPFEQVLAQSEVRNTDTFGVLKLTLYADRYTWQFLPVAGASFTDFGGAACH